MDDRHTLDVTVPAGVRKPAGTGFGRWIGWRLAFGALTILAISVLVFLATQALPSDPARAILGRTATPASIAQLRHDLGLDRPLIQQYGSWLWGVVRGDFGTSLAARMPVTDFLSERAVNSIVLMAVVALIAIPLSFALGVVTAVRRGPLDRVVFLVAIGLASLPEFVVALLLVICFSTTVFELLPAVSTAEGGLLSNVDGLVLPVGTLVLVMTSYLYRLVRASMIEVLGSEYVSMARLKGLPPRTVILRHAFRNALLPGIQGAALVAGWLLGSAVVVETVFQYPGLGSALTDAMNHRDVPVIQAIVLVFGFGIVVFNLVADILVRLASPRLRTGGGAR